MPIAVAGILWFLPTTVFWMRFVQEWDGTPSGRAIVLCAVVCLLPFGVPRSYMFPRAFERGAFYPALGVRLFRRLAPDGDAINRRLRRFDPTYRAVPDRTALRTHIMGTYSNERAHLALFLAGLFTAGLAVATGEWLMAGLVSVGNILFNLYPAMHQRYKRARIRRSPAMALDR